MSQTMKVEIVGGDLVLTMPLKTTVCPACGRSFRDVLSRTAKFTVDASTPPVALVELADREQWRWVYPPTYGPPPLYICPDCSAPIREAEEAGSAGIRKSVVDLFDRMGK